MASSSIVRHSDHREHVPGESSRETVHPSGTYGPTRRTAFARRLRPGPVHADLVARVNSEQVPSRRPTARISRRPGIQPAQVPLTQTNLELLQICLSSPPAVRRDIEAACRILSAFDLYDEHRASDLWNAHTFHGRQHMFRFSKHLVRTGGDSGCDSKDSRDSFLGPNARPLTPKSPPSVPSVEPSNSQGDASFPSAPRTPGELPVPDIPAD
jgi:hypothetical protein